MTFHIITGYIGHNHWQFAMQYLPLMHGTDAATKDGRLDTGSEGVRMVR